MFSCAVQDWRSSANSIPSGRVWKVSEVILSVAWTLLSRLVTPTGIAGKRVTLQKMILFVYTEIKLP